jgi:ABC-2 type transport system permease protein
VIGNLVGSTIAGVPTSWDSSPSELAYIVLGNVLALLVGFMLGVLIRNSPAAIVAYFVYSFVLPTLLSLLADNAAWFRSAQPWLDFHFDQGALFGGEMSGEQWANLGVTGILWLILPLTAGIWLVLRSEVK